MVKMKYLILLSMYLFTNPLLGQKMFWSDMTGKDKQDALSVSEQFITCFDNSDYEGIEKLLSDKDIFIGDSHWLNKQQCIEELRNIQGNIKFPDHVASAYTFDEFLDNHLNNVLIQRTFEVYDNHSVLVHMPGNDDGTILDGILVIRKTRDSSWEITGIEGIIPKGNINSVIDRSDFRIEKISNAGIQVLLPKDFIGPDRINDQVIFYYEGNSGRDAAFQVMTDQLQGRIYYYTFKFVEHNNQQFKLSDLIVRYLPVGIMYEYVVVDPDGVKNKGITIGIEKGDKAILIQYYAFMEVYKQMKEQVDHMLANIKL
jgi:hypothetical protein